MLLNIIVLLLEVLYYSLFMKFARKEGKLWRYIISFILISIIGLFIKTNYLMSYIILIILIVTGLKSIVRIKISLYDIFFIFIMLIVKTLLETVLLVPSYYILKNMFLATLIAGIFKTSVIMVLRNKIGKYYTSIKDKWNKNNFYIRYIFTTLMFLYIIISCLFLIFNK